MSRRILDDVGEYLQHIHDAKGMRWTLTSEKFVTMVTDIIEQSDWLHPSRVYNSDRVQCNSN